jgi:cobalt-zinc-cadmium efflux system protein
MRHLYNGSMPTVPHAAPASTCPHASSHAPLRGVATPAPHAHDHADEHGHCHAQTRTPGHDHDHGHDRTHGHDYRGRDKRLLALSFVITAITMFAEILGGWLTRSLALVSDGVHMFTHAFALGLSWAAIMLAARPANRAKTYGYYRIEVIAAFVNGITILASAIWIVAEALQRLITPEPVDIVTTLVIAAVGLIVNLITGAILLRGDQTNMNIRSAFLHMLTDTLSSVAIIAGLIAIHYTAWQWIDPLIAVVVAIVIVRWSWSLLTRSFNVLMEGSTVDVDRLTAHVLREFPEVLDLHDVHVWQIAEHFNCMTAHVAVRADSVADYSTLVRRIGDSLKTHYEIGHVNLQPECVAATIS